MGARPFSPAPQSNRNTGKTKMYTSKFAQYAAEESNRMFVGELVKYIKGEWVMGSDRDLVSPDKHFVAVMATLTVGHLKWIGGQPVDSKMGLVADGFRPVHRNELDDLDSKTWEVGENNDLKDPWQRTTLLVLAAAAAPYDLVTFSTSTAGGQGAIRDLCSAHSRTTEGSGKYPVVTLATDSYIHKIRARGRVDVPVFNIVDCVEAGPFNAIVAEARGGAGFIPTSPPALATPSVGPIAITSGRQPPVPPEPPIDELTMLPEPPLHETVPEGPDVDGYPDDDEPCVF
jgi:hypothetical protein